MFFNPHNRLASQQDRAQELMREREQQEVLRNRQLMHEQNAEYAQALAADKARLEQQARLQAEKIEEELRLKNEQNEMKRKKQRLMDLHKEIRKSLESEKVPLPNDKNIVRVRVKFPSGYILNRNFFAEDSLEVCNRDDTLINLY